MCLDHVYIVLEPVGSARLTFDDDLYYELCDLMTEVCSESRMRSRHDEESRKGREVKIDILEGYIRTPEWFQNVSGIFQRTGRLQEPPRGSSGPSWALVERRGGLQGWPHTPHGKSELDWGGGGAPPLSFSPLPPSVFSYLD